MMSTPHVANGFCCVSTLLQAQEWIRATPRWLRVAAALLLLPLAASALPAPTPTLDQAQQKMAGVAVPFEANQGQFAPEVAFAARTFAGTVFVTKDGKIVHALAGKPNAAISAEAAASFERRDRNGKSDTSRGPGWALVESLQGAGELVPVGSQPSVTRVSRLGAGAAPNQISNIATFDRVRVGEGWPGVSVELAARGRNVEKLFTVAPRTNPKTIRISVAGAKHLRLGNDGSLIATTGNGDVAFTPPVAFQEIGGQRTGVPVRYVLLADNGYRFETGSYDRSQSLVIDPLLQSTYLGGSNDDRLFALAFDASGNVLVAGTTHSTNFPGTSGGAQPVSGGNLDAFVARLSANLMTLVQSTYLGGSGFESINALTLDAGGNVFVAGNTLSTSLPGTMGGAQPATGGGSDAFVARLSSDLTMLVQATYLGGGGDDSVFRMAIDASGNVLVAGVTSSINFPGTTSGAQPASGGNDDAFIARLSGNLGTLVQATYLGGTNRDEASALAIDAGGNVLVAGYTISNDFPHTSGAAQPTFGGGSEDTFVARLSPNLATLTQATYLGGSGDDFGVELTLDSAGNVLFAGYTSSINFPGTAGGAQPAFGGGTTDAFVAWLSSNLDTLVQATYLGGSGDDQATAMALDSAGSLLIAGYTTSTTFARTMGGTQSANAGGGDGYVARLSSNLATLVQATYLGGSNFDVANRLALDAGGNVVVAGFTESTNFPGTSGGAQPANGGGTYDVFVAKLTPDLQGNSIFSNGFE